MRGLSRSLLLLGPAVILAGDPLRLAAQTAPPPAISPAPATQPAFEIGAAATTRPASAPAKEISVNFQQASIDAVLDYLSDKAGFIVVKPGPIDARVTVVSRQPVTPEEAVTLLDTVLNENGYTAVQRGRILTVMSKDKAKKGSIPVHFGDDPSQIEPSDQLVTQVIPLRSVDAVKLKTDLQPLISTSDTDITANAASNTLIITDTEANIRRIVEIVSSLDKRDATENSIRVKQLKYADATAAAKLITDIFKPPEQQGQANNQNVPPQVRFFQALRAGRGGGGPGGGGAGGADSGDQGRTAQIVASADERTNTVVVSGPSDTLKVIDAVLDQLDANPASEQTFFIYAVKNGQAQDIAATLNSLFGVSGSTTGTGANRTGTAGYGTRTTSSGISGGLGGGGFGGGGGGLGGGGFGGGGGGFGGGGGGFGGGGGGFGGGGGGFGGNTANRGTSGTINRGAVGGVGGAANTALSNGTGNTASELIGQVYVVPDVDTNSLLIATATKYEQRVRDIIAQLDRPVPQVLIKVLIAEVSHDDSTDLGLDFSILNIRPSGNGQKGGTNFGNAVATGGLVVNLLESNITATLHALAVNGKLDVLSRPYILTSDNQEATVMVGQYVPFITESRLDVNSNTINTIQYQNIGIILDVTPHINPEGIVTLDVAPEISSLTSTTVQISPGVDAPVYQVRSANSRVSIKDGQTIVIGGLMEDRNTQTIQKVPLLGDIPGLGVLFQRNKVEKTKTELLIFMTPHVAKEPERLKPMSQDEIRGTKLVPNAVQPGTFQDQMRGMERGGATTQPATPQLPGIQ